MSSEANPQAWLQKYESAVLPLTRLGEMGNPDASRLLNIPATALFPGALSAVGAVSGLLLKMGVWEASHHLSQALITPEGSYWHGIAHRMEPDAFNAGYWFRRVGKHPILPALRDGASEVLEKVRPPGWRVPANWDHSLFIEWCEEARQAPGTAEEEAALAIQELEWKLLFSWCRHSAG